jgi:hypothetical protein
VQVHKVLTAHWGAAKGLAALLAAWVLVSSCTPAPVLVNRVARPRVRVKVVATWRVQLTLMGPRTWTWTAH